MKYHTLAIITILVESKLHSLREFVTERRLIQGL